MCCGVSNKGVRFVNAAILQVHCCSYTVVIYMLKPCVVGFLWYGFDYFFQFFLVKCNYFDTEVGRKLYYWDMGYIFWIQLSI